MDKEYIDVAAALIWQDDQFLIAQRPAHKARGLLWEFVGGKREAGESLPQTLARECREELGIEIEVGSLFMELDHIYPDIKIHLSLFNAKIASGTPKLIEHNDLRFITPKEIDGYEFCPADAEILERLKAAAK